VVPFREALQKLAPFLTHTRLPTEAHKRGHKITPQYFYACSFSYDSLGLKAITNSASVRIHLFA
jgi:hypothetical protein